MSSVIDRLSGRKRKSAYKAKERVQLVLIHDRTNLPSNVLETMKDEINKDGRQQRLIADIPILGPRRGQ